jgi:NADH dehydrogenase
MSNKTRTQRIVVVGGGFGGVKTALELADDESLEVTLISDKDFFVYYPALYATATGGSHLQSFVPLSEIFRTVPNVTIVQDTVVGIDTNRRHVTGASKKLYEYDMVVFALGVVTSYFGIKGIDKYSYSIKTHDELVRFKRHLHDEVVADHHLDKHYVVVGAGPTGVELSAALASYLKHIAANHEIKRAKVRIKLVEAAPRVMPRMSEKASALIDKRLRDLGVDVMVNKRVESEDDDSIMVSGKDIESKTVVWTSGVSNHPFYAEHADLFELSKNGRVVVDEHMLAAPDVYVIGDNAFTPFSGLAQTALHDAIFVAKVIKARAHHRDLPKYHAVKPPVVVPVGRNWSILEWGPIRVTGILGSWIRRAADMIGYHDILPIGQALGVWRAEYIHEEECASCKSEPEKA